MSPSRKDVTDAELALLEVLWDEGEATIRRLTDVVYPGDSPSDYATVKKLLSRLEGKGYVRRDRRAMAHVFKARRSRGELIDQRLQAVANNLCGGSRTPLLLHLLRSERLTEREQEELRALLDDLTRKKSKRQRH